jgi:hypothetical protein
MTKLKNDFILVLVIAVAASSLWLGIYLNRSEGAYAYVTVDGVEYGQYLLNTDAEIRIGDDSTYNILVIKDGYAEITEASCPNKLCVHQGKIHYDGQSIICLPNKVVVEIVGGDKWEVDVVAK